MNLEMLLEMVYHLLFCEAAVTRLKDLQVSPVAVWCGEGQCGAVWCSVVQCTSVWWSVLQFGEVCCSVM